TKSVACRKRLVFCTLYFKPLKVFIIIPLILRLLYSLHFVISGWFHQDLSNGFSSCYGGYDGYLLIGIRQFNIIMAATDTFFIWCTIRICKYFSFSLTFKIPG